MSERRREERPSRYEIVHLLHFGAFGAIYIVRAEQPKEGGSEVPKEVPPKESSFTKAIAALGVEGGEVGGRSGPESSQD